MLYNSLLSISDHPFQTSLHQIQQLLFRCPGNEQIVHLNSRRRKHRRSPPLFQKIHSRRKMILGGVCFMLRPRSATALSSRLPRRLAASSSSSTTSQLSSSSLASLEMIEKDSPRQSFQVTAPYEPMGDQPQAIEQLVKQLDEGDRFSILKGITGTGKTFVMSHCIAKHGKPTLILCHNKTLAAQLARELRSFLGGNAVELFVSFYNHYIPESYNEASGRYVAKKSSINQEIDAMRHRATRALLMRQDVVVVASVSCIYGLGLPTEYLDASMNLNVGDVVEEGPEDFLSQLDAMLYVNEQTDDEFGRGTYQYNQTLAECDIIVWPPNESFPMKIKLRSEMTSSSPSLWKVKYIQQGHSMGHSDIDSTCLFPAKHHVMPEERLEAACLDIEQELRERVKELMSQRKFEEANRLQQRVSNDLLLLRETGFCPGGENYSRHFAQRAAGEPPNTLMDYLGLDGREWLLVVDESHVTLPQLRAMYAGDRARKQRLVKHGYRLPSALDNRPLRDDEFWQTIQKGVFVSATPAKQEMEWAERKPIDMVIRPTFVCDPVIEVRPIEGQLKDLVEEIQSRAKRQERTLAVALTKRDAEDLSDYLNEHSISSAFIHSGLNIHERADALKALQNGKVDCLVGVNLLREGLDLPQVSLVAILNADSEGFLRSETALLQTVGRAARNAQGKAIFYANRITASMNKCLVGTKERREKQLLYNLENGCSMKSAKGSSVLSIFDLLKDQIAAEQPLQVVGREHRTLDVKKDGDVLDDEFRVRSDVMVQVPEGEARDLINTDHVPSSPGVYFWKDENGEILYIGKAKRLRTRVKSYLRPKSRHSARIEVMLDKARRIDFVLTGSERDALLLESNLIKHHQPPYNILLKDDTSYPYICASVGDQYPRFFATPQRQDRLASSKYRYFGPYPHYNECNQILEAIESQYDLRAKSFMARHGDMTHEDYLEIFDAAINENFGSSSSKLNRLRSKFEEAGHLFDSEYNVCRDVVSFSKIPDQNESTGLVHIVQLREGLVAGQFSYECKIPSGMSNEEDHAAVIAHVLERQHYPSGEETLDARLSFFPTEILVPHPIVGSATRLKQVIQAAQTKASPSSTGKQERVAIRTVAKRGVRKKSDEVALNLCVENAGQAAYDKALESIQGSVKSSVDGTALKELQKLFNLDKKPSRIECYDISHNHGDFPVGSRVVFIDGKKEPSLYRKFNIKSVDGVDDYASLQEVLSRRFQRAWVNGAGGAVAENDPWSLPDIILIDGGPGQLNSAVDALVSQRIFPADGFYNLPTKGSKRSATVVVCSLAKGVNRKKDDLYVYGSNEPINTSTDSPALLLLRSLRDESHRFALNAHRSRRSIRKST
mmetsp:Transcript_1112/g.1711  ORF Transcript_1112/g.1711 Transcript_1112/m.1711 type:complete len:1351 (-) Transcript_1112:283-4335(-)